MPSSEHVRKLRQGARAWNAWRCTNPLMEPQLGELSLPVGHKQFGSAQGGPIDLSQADLCRASLDHATLTAANLTGAYLVQANLSHARLKGANLSGANLSNARLDHADMSDVELTAARLTGANLRDARNLTQAQIDKAYGDDSTRLPLGLAMPAGWRKGKTKPSTELARRLAFEPVGRKANPYALLGVSPQASLKDIRAAYVQLVKALHPDGRALDPTGAERLKAVNKAYQDLKVRARQREAQPAPARSSFRRGAFLVGFLGSSLTLLAVAGGLMYVGLLGTSEVQPRLAPESRQQDSRRTESWERTARDDAKERANARKHPAESEAAAPAAARAAADDAAWLEAKREGTSASLHRYLGRYANGRHVADATAALPTVANAEIALSQALDAPGGTTSARASLRQYLDLYPGGRLAGEVNRKLNVIAAAEAAHLADRAAWAEAERAGTTIALRLYVAAHPDGANAAHARQTIAALEALQAQRAADHADWVKARADSGKAPLRRYLAAHPDGDHAAEAQQGLAALEAREARLEADRTQWAKAEASGSKEAFEDYLAALPDGEHAGHARALLHALAALQARQETERLARAPSLAAHDPQEAAPSQPTSEPAQDPLSAPPQLLATPEERLEGADEERLRDDADWLKAQRRNTKAAYAAYLLTHPNGRHVKEAHASVTEVQAPPPRTKSAGGNKGFKRITQAFGAGSADAPASQKWQSADEPFIGADGRLRQR
jgi:DnaJ-like protein/pentapeptide repeat protein